jgi:hypothetical protein
MSNLTPAFQGEFMLASWKENHTSGATVTFMLADAGDLDIFRSMTVRKSNLAGQRFMAVLVEIGCDEKPMTQRMSVQAALMCKSMGFQQFAEFKQGFSYESPADRELQATHFLRKFCNVESRAELDGSGPAGVMFQQLLSEYRNYSNPSF